MQRALYVHQRKTKHFIAKLLAQPFMVLQTFLKSMTSSQKHLCFGIAAEFFTSSNTSMKYGYAISILSPLKDP